MQKNVENWLKGRFELFCLVHLWKKMSHIGYEKKNFEVKMEADFL